MVGLTTRQNTDLATRMERREAILQLEAMLLETPGATVGDSPLAPLNHLFCDGMYVRQIFLPKGVFGTGMIHKHAHPSFVLTGDVGVFTEEEGYSRIIAPKCFISQPGTKRVVYAYADTIWVTVHLNPDNEQDPRALREMNVADNYNEIEPSIVEALWHSQES